MDTIDFSLGKTVHLTHKPQRRELPPHLHEGTLSWFPLLECDGCPPPSDPFCRQCRISLNKSIPHVAFGHADVAH
eukprot:1823760-Rhodomonas_salina.2